MKKLMKYIIYILLFSFSINSHAQYNKKKLHIRSGENAYRSHDSSSKNRERTRGIASTTKVENRIAVTKVDNTYYYSNGSSTTKVGNTYYNSNGTYCEYTKTSVYCNY